MARLLFLPSVQLDRCLGRRQAPQTNLRWGWLRLRRVMRIILYGLLLARSGNRRFYGQTWALAPALGSDLICSLLVEAWRCFIEPTMVVRVAPPLGGSLGSSSGHGVETGDG